MKNMLYLHSGIEFILASASSVALGRTIGEMLGIFLAMWFMVLILLLFCYILKPLRHKRWVVYVATTLVYLWVAWGRSTRGQDIGICNAGAIACIFVTLKLFYRNTPRNTDDKTPSIKTAVKDNHPSMADEEHSEKTAIFVGGILEADRDFLQPHNGKNISCFQSFRVINIDGRPEKSSSVGNGWLLATIIFCGLGLVLCGVSVESYTIEIVGIIAIFGVILYLMMHGFFLNIFAGIKKVCVFLAEIGKSFFEELILPFSGCLLPIIMEITTFGAIVVTAGWLHEEYRWNLFGAFFAAGCFAHIPFVGKIIAIIAVIQAFNWNPFWAILCFTWHYILFALIAVKKDKIS